MSEAESFLERWARRKREAANIAGLPDAASSAPDDPQRAGDMELGGELESKRLDPRARDEAEPPPDFDLAQLPSLDSITAETDIRAFLLPGVPAELSRAALRRAWSADPAIREFVGLADYDWDFNTEGAIPGFGPLEMTDELRRLVTDMVGRNLAPQQPKRLVTSAAEPGATTDADENLGDFNASAALKPASKRPGVEAAGDEAAPREGPSRNCEETGPTSSKYTALQHLPQDTAERHSEVFPRRHGRALPRS